MKFFFLVDLNMKLHGCIMFYCVATKCLTKAVSYFTMLLQIPCTWNHLNLPDNFFLIILVMMLVIPVYSNNKIKWTKDTKSSVSTLTSKETTNPYMETWKIFPGIFYRCPGKVSTNVNNCRHTPHQGMIAGSTQSLPPLLYWHFWNEWKDKFLCRINQQSSRFCKMITWNINNLLWHQLFI